MLSHVQTVPCSPCRVLSLLVLPRGSQSVHLSSRGEDGLSSGRVLLLPLPGGETAGLKSSPVREGQLPGLAARSLVDEVKMDRGVQFRLSP